MSKETEGIEKQLNLMDKFKSSYINVHMVSVSMTRQCVNC
jgi:hypothetical protein